MLLLFVLQGIYVRDDLIADLEERLKDMTEEMLNSTSLMNKISSEREAMRDPTTKRACCQAIELALKTSQQRCEELSQLLEKTETECYLKSKEALEATKTLKALLQRKRRENADNIPDKKRKSGTEVEPETGSEKTKRPKSAKENKKHWETERSSRTQPEAVSGSNYSENDSGKRARGAESGNSPKSSASANSRRTESSICTTSVTRRDNRRSGASGSDNSNSEGGKKRSRYLKADCGDEQEMVDETELTCDEDRILLERKLLPCEKQLRSIIEEADRLMELADKNLMQRKRLSIDANARLPTGKNPPYTRIRHKDKLWQRLAPKVTNINETVMETDLHKELRWVPVSYLRFFPFEFQAELYCSHLRISCSL